MTSSGAPTWWNNRRLGVFVHANVATVPGFAPIGQYAEWYRAHLGEPVADVVLHPTPLPEVLAHHRDRWGHVERYDDFAELLTFDRFDPEDWATLVEEAGAGYSVFVAKHHDGWAWWDAPGSTRRLTETGPRRDVLGEYAAACERHDVVFGTYLSLLDWGDGRAPGEGYVDEALHPQAIDLVERYGSAYLWGDGHWGHGEDRWRSSELVERLLAIRPDLLLNDRWRLPRPDPDEPSAPTVVRTFEYEVPDQPLERPWELCRGLGPSFGYNRAEGPEHQLSPEGLVALHTEVVAKGGHLLIDVGPGPDGTIPEVQATTLRRAGTWIRAHADVLDRSRPWHHWGDDHVRYLDVDGVLHAIDVTGRGRFADLVEAHHPVRSIERLGVATEPGDRPAWHQDERGLHVDLRPPVGWDGPSGPAVYRIELAPELERISLFDLGEPAPVPLAPLLEATRSGDVVQLGEGVYAGPAEVPPGVILRGLGRDRTTITAGAPTTIRPAGPAVRVGRNARIEHLRITAERQRRTAMAASPSLVLLDAPFGTVLGCEVAGALEVTGPDAVVRASSAAEIRVEGADRTSVSRCTLRGDHWDVGIEVIGGADHEIESCTLRDHLAAIRLTETVDAVVRGCRVEARWWGIHAVATERTHVHGNQVAHTMRAVDVDGGTGALVEGNAVDGGDSGCLVQSGATGVVVRGNHWHGTRIGLLTWNADPSHGDNVAADLGDPDGALVSGP